MGCELLGSFSSVVNWMSVCLLLIISLIHDLPPRSINFVLEFSQGDHDVLVYMEMPQGINF